MANDDRGLEITAGTIRFVAERDTAQKCADQVNEDYSTLSFRHEKIVAKHREDMDALYERTEKMEAAMLINEAGTFAESSKSLHDAIDRCRALLQSNTCTDRETP